MNWFGSGFVPIIIYSSGTGSGVDSTAIVTETNLDIFTETSIEILTE